MKKIYLLIMVISFLVSCNKDDLRQYSINGYAQKGPFIAGSLITISELDVSLNPTGKNYYSSTKNEFGYFEFPNVEFSSDYVELIADGYYYDESLDAVLSLNLVLKSIVEIEDSKSINVNILTHLERDRLIHLVKNEGMNFSDAKKQSRNELFQIFNIDSNNYQNLEYYDLSNKDKQNSILIAISSILQYYKSGPYLTSFLAEFIEDFGPDGQLNNSELQSRIARDAQFVDVGSIRKNLTKFYSDTIFNEFHQYIQNFILNTNFQPNIKLSFPETTTLGRNFLGMLDNALISNDSVYCACIDLSNINLCTGCFWMYIEIVKVSESGEFNVEINDTNWQVFLQDSNHCSLTFNQGISNYSIPALVTFKNHGEVMLTFQLYFISNNENHVWSKSIKW